MALEVAFKCASADELMPDVETNTRRVIARLRQDGWMAVGGTRHDKFEHPDRDYPIVVPRHRELSPGVARSIARHAGWI